MSKKHNIKRLNLGCGTDIKKGYINVDFIENRGVDVVYDLNKYPYPFKDNSVEEIYARDIMEHLDNPNKFIKELWRIGEPNCKICIRVPHFSSLYAWADLTHHRPFSYFVMNHYDINNKDTDSLLSKTDVRFKVNSHINFGIYGKLGLGWLANKFPFIYERYLAYSFPAGDVQFNIEVIKT